MTPELIAAIEHALGSVVRVGVPIAGGDINQAFCVTLENGERVFVKTNATAPPRLFALEARGLEWLSETRTVRVPRVLAYSERRPQLLILEYLEPRSRRVDFDRALGLQLAALHRASAPAFGLDHDNFIASLPQSNQATETWQAFYIEQRLQPQLERSLRQRVAPERWVSRFDRLFAQIGDLLTLEPPQRLHGDLWSGNVHVGAGGEPILIDPAVYAGHREIDLAMMRLFGGFGSRVFDAYEGAFPLLPGWRERVALYQLYPLLVHVNLFGAGYVGQVDQALGRLP